MFLSWIVAIWVRLTKFIEEKEPKVLEVRGSNNKNEIYNNYNNKKIKKKIGLKGAQALLAPTWIRSYSYIIKM